LEAKEVKMEEIVASCIALEKENFDAEWGRFETIVNNQGQQTTPKGKITVEFNAQSNDVNLKVLESCYTEGIYGLIEGSGLKTAIGTLLKSDSIIKASSLSYQINTLDANGNKRSSSELQNELMSMAFEWLAGRNPFRDPVGDYLIGQTFDLTLYGELPNGREFSIQYNLNFC